MIDIARGGALIAMAIYHFTWDLEFFGFLTPGTIQETGWVTFARSIASTFLFLAGVSLYLAHANGIRWANFRNRWFKVAGAAALISIATWFAIPDAFIFFGILHAIALFSIVSLVLIKAPWWLTLAVALLVFFATPHLQNDIFNSPLMWWTGLSTEQPQSNDYVPMFPWFSATLAGLGLAQLSGKLGLFSWLENKGSGGRSERTLGVLGRHSLLTYLVHQPVLLAGLWVFTAIAGPPDRTPAFLSGCQANCVKDNDAAFCTRFCQCTADGLKSAKLFTPFFKGEVDLSTDAKGQAVIQQCSIENGLEPRMMMSEC